MASGLSEVVEQLLAAARPRELPWMMARKARVVAVHSGGGMVDAMNARYSVDVQPLTREGGVDAEMPVICDVELPVVWGGPGRGVYALPAIGTVVRLGFYWGDPSQPYIDAVLADGYVVPEHPLGSLIIQHGPGVKIEIQPTGKVVVSGVGVELFAGDPQGGTRRIVTEDWVLALFDTHTHPTPAGASSPPTPAPHTGISQVKA
ncbi:MAG: hypothetical protein HUU55_07680 [Myxococcales bacterium]|nr:hypothetical protein [Myxococcales bacterium]